MIELVAWQKEQDEAKYKYLTVDELLIEREKIESLIEKQDKMALINYELKQLNISEHSKSYLTDLEAKYKALLHSYNELLIAIENPTAYNLANPYRLHDLINKAKNI